MNIKTFLIFLIAFAPLAQAENARECVRFNSSGDLSQVSLNEAKLFLGSVQGYKIEILKFDRMSTEELSNCPEELAKNDSILKLNERESDKHCVYFNEKQQPNSSQGLVCAKSSPEEFALGIEIANPAQI